jgi:hypothetical protein
MVNQSLPGGVPPQPLHHDGKSIKIMTLLAFPLPL